MVATERREGILIVSYNGETNSAFGVYRNLCCSAEIVIPAGVTFPSCAAHLAHPTVWKPVPPMDRFIGINQVFVRRRFLRVAESDLDD